MAKTIRDVPLFQGNASELSDTNNRVLMGAGPFARFIDEKGNEWQQTGNVNVGTNGWVKVRDRGVLTVAAPRADFLFNTEKSFSDIISVISVIPAEDPAYPRTRIVFEASAANQGNVYLHPATESGGAPSITTLQGSIRLGPGDIYEDDTIIAVEWFGAASIAPASLYVREYYNVA